MLFYVIKTDTMGLERGASSNDPAAHFFFQPKVDDDDLVISYLGILKYPNSGAEIADILLRLQGVKWVICSGMYKHDIFLLRSRSWKDGADNLAKLIIGKHGVAGGLDKMAGGQIRIINRDPSQLLDQLTNGAIQQIRGDASMAGIRSS